MNEDVNNGANSKNISVVMALPLVVKAGNFFLFLFLFNFKYKTSIDIISFCIMTCGKVVLSKFKL